MATRPARTALIVGAGIGGLAAGLALRRAGWQVQIHERAANPRELGFALALAPNAMAALRELGLADTMIAEGVQTTRAEVRRSDGRVIRAFEAAFDPRFRAITAATEPGDMRFDELCERQALFEWGTGRITLLGDAAHPLLPHTRQGAAQALEDAVALGLALGPPGDVEPALRRYERVRSRRTRRLVKLGPRIARITTTKNPLVTLLRTTAVQWLPASVLASTAPGRGRDPHRQLRNPA